MAWHRPELRVTALTSPVRRIRPGTASPESRPQVGPLARAVITIGAAVVVALVAQGMPARFAPIVVISAPLFVLALVLVRRLDPKWLLATLVLSTFLGWSQFSSSVGRVNLRLTDVPYVALVASLLFVSGRASAKRADIGQRSLAILLLVFGLSLIPVLVTDSTGFFSPLVSWLRLVETFSIVWLTPYVLKRPSDARFVMGTVAGACAIELGRAVLDAWAHGQLSGRIQGGNGPDTEGLLAAVLIVTVVYGMVPRRPSVRATLIGLGVLSLVLSRSVASVLAVGLVLAFALPPRRGGRRPAIRIAPAHATRRRIGRNGRCSRSRCTVRERSGLEPICEQTTMSRVIMGVGGLDIFASTTRLSESDSRGAHCPVCWPIRGSSPNCIRGFPIHHPTSSQVSRIALPRTS